MSGIYIHIPFCKKKCHYCNFHFSTTLQLKSQLINSIAEEIILQKNYLNTTIETIYFGGGTPSLLNENELEVLMNTIYNNFNVSKNVEITLEANPDDINEVQLNSWKKIGINRLSIGVQSFVDADLQYMNRAHNALQAKQCIELALQNGFTNLSIDLIYGTPNLSNEDWINNIEISNQFGITHLSCYALTVEPNTSLEKMILQKKTEPVDANKAAEQFEILMKLAPILGFEHYEISNFAKIGFRSKHNSSYWKGIHYLGLGPSAHSYNGISRHWNIANNSLYISSLNKKTIPFEIEYLTEKQKINEYIMTSLRLKEGIDLDKLENKNLLDKAQKFINQNLMIFENGYLKLTDLGKLRADGIASELFL